MGWSGVCFRVDPVLGWLDLGVDAIMTRNPKTVAPDQLVSEAMEILNTSKVSVLLVVDNARPIGIVHFHHLLRAGVA